MTYIFDFDGTLVDSMPIFSKTIIKLFDEYKLPYTDDTVEFLTPLGYKGIAEYAITLGLKMSKAEFIKKATDYMAYEYHNNIPAKKFVKEILVDFLEMILWYSFTILIQVIYGLLVMMK